MKTSSKILLVLAGVIILGLIILVVSFRGFAGRVMRDVPAGTSFEESGNRVERSYDLEGFSAVESVGGWELEINQGEGYGITITADEKVHEVLRVRRQGDTLVLGFEPGFKMGGVRLSAVLTMPQLERLEAEGGLKCRFSGFSGNGLLLDVAGGADIRGSGGEYRRIEIFSEGAANLDLYALKTVNADVVVNGLGNIQLNMDGGDLTGELSGAVNLTYRGRVSRMDVKKNGLANVSQE